jgi:AP2-like factor (euAP2 lineage)
VERDSLVAYLRQQSRGPRHASSDFKGVTRHAKGRWEARIGKAAGGDDGTGRKYR